MIIKFTMLDGRVMEYKIVRATISEYSAFIYKKDEPPPFREAMNLYDLVTRIPFDNVRKIEIEL